MIYVEGKSTVEQKSVIKKVYKAALKHFLQKDIFDVYIEFLDEKDMRELNKRTRQVDSITDVLSFPSYQDFSIPLTKEDVKSDRVFGEIAVCMQRIAEQAVEYGHSEARELGYLTAHGLCHLFGFDHIDDNTEMRKHEEAIMQSVGLKRRKE